MSKAARKRSQQQRRDQVAHAASNSETILTVCSTPPKDEEGPRLENELQLVKSALLYGDRVEIISPGSSFARTLKPFLSVTEDNVLEVVSHMPPEALQRLGVGTDFGRGMDLRKFRRRLRELHRLPADNPSRIEAFEQWRPAALSMYGTADEYFSQRGSYELEMAFERADIELLNPGFDIEHEVPELIDTFRDSLLASLDDPRRSVLLDPAGDEIAREHPGAQTAYSGARARRTSTGTGLIQRLPTFPNAPMQDVLEARDELSDGRAGYRRAVKDLADELLSAPFESSLPVELDDLWHDTVEPALIQLRKRATATRVAHETGKDLIGSSSGGFATLAVTLASLGSFADLLPTSAALAAGGANVAFAGVRAAFRARAEVRAYDLVYLHDVNKSLGDFGLAD